MSKFCGKCGAPTDESAAVCANCGAPLKPRVQAPAARAAEAPQDHSAHQADVTAATLPLDTAADWDADAALSATVPLEPNRMEENPALSATLPLEPGKGRNEDVTVWETLPMEPIVKRNADAAAPGSVPNGGYQNRSAWGGGNDGSKNVAVIAAAAVAIVALIVACILLINNNAGSSGKSSHKNGERKESSVEAAAKKAMDAYCNRDAAALQDMSADIWFADEASRENRFLEEEYQRNFNSMDPDDELSYELGQTKELSDAGVKSLIGDVFSGHDYEDYYGRIMQVEVSLTLDSEKNNYKITVTTYVYLIKESGQWNLLMINQTDYQV